MRWAVGAMVLVLLTSLTAAQTPQAIVQSCAAGDRDRCIDDTTRCFRDCDTLERCNRTCCVAFHGCLASHGCSLEAPMCKGL